MTKTANGAGGDPSDRPSWRTSISFGLGAVAFGVKDGGFNYFLLLFYGTVVGLEPGLVGLAIFIALFVDALSDPLVGYWSDNFRSRWGRRHPFIYASALPCAVSFWFLWNPPDGWSDAQLFAYLLVVAIIIRTAITFYQTPSSAMLPELSSNYRERTRLEAYRVFFGWLGGASLAALMFGVWLVPTEEFGDGILNRDAYSTYGFVASILMFLSIVISGIGTHSEIAGFRDPPVRDRRLSIREIFREIYESLADKSFLAIFWTAVLGSTATGVSTSLTFIMWTYFWGFDEGERFLLTAFVFLSVLVAFLLAPLAVRVWGKKRAVIRLGIVAFTVLPGIVALRLAGLLPENGDSALFPTVAVIYVIDMALVIAAQIVIYSMVADLVEGGELRTGRRSEGVYYSAITFTRKTVVGIGALIGGLILSAVAIPDGADPSSVAEDKLFTLGALYAPALFILWMGMLGAVSRYRIDEATHEANLRRLQERRGG
ncbi:MFS transporter [Erythrobacteraceae bacterium WH01K]|nr:MFS transporter [Erythrobacteraceae bacterium WH01K]